VDEALCAAKLEGECDEVHTGLTRLYVKSPVTTSEELYHVYQTWDPHAAALTRHFSSSMEPLFIRGRVVCAEKMDGECDEEHTGLTRHHVKFPVTKSAELYRVYRTWDPHAGELRRLSAAQWSPSSSVDGAVCAAKLD
jgi:hypothetical protein